MNAVAEAMANSANKKVKPGSKPSKKSPIVDDQSSDKNEEALEDEAGMSRKPNGSRFASFGKKAKL